MQLKTWKRIELKKSSNWRFRTRTILQRIERNIVTRRKVLLRIQEKEVSDFRNREKENGFSEIIVNRRFSLEYSRWNRIKK